jgi:hypothetical protein
MSRHNRISTRYEYIPGHIITMVEHGRLDVNHVRPPEPPHNYIGLLRIATASDSLSRNKLLKGEARAALVQWARLAGRLSFELVGSDPEPPREVPVVWFHVTRDRTTEPDALLAYSEPLPDELVTNWGQATPEEIAAAVRESVRHRHTFGTSRRAPTETELDELVAHSMTLPRRQQHLVVGKQPGKAGRVCRIGEINLADR